MPIETSLCNLYIDCVNDQLDAEALFRMLLKDDAGCPAISVIGSGGGGLPVGLATEATLALLNGQFTPVVRIPSLSVVLGVSVAPVPAGARSVTFFNQGPTAATVAGGVLDAGESVTFDADGENDTLGAIAVTTIALGVLKISKVV